MIWFSSKRRETGKTICLKQLFLKIVYRNWTILKQLYFNYLG